MEKQKVKKEPPWGILLHGGAGNYEAEKIENSRPFLKDLLGKIQSVLFEGGAKQAVRFGIKALEDHPDYNAGTGSQIQSDGVVRMTACYMDSQKLKFSSVVNITDIQNPIELALLLQEEKHCCIGGEGATQLAQKWGFPYWNPKTPQRLEQWKNRGKGRMGTVGLCVLDKEGVLAQGTSTGGVGYETPGRISDDASPSGGYCSSEIALSATGVGEDFIRLGTLVRLAALIDYGIETAKAMNFVESHFKNNLGEGGWIGVDRLGQLSVFHNTGGMRFAGINHLGDFFLS